MHLDRANIFIVGAGGVGSEAVAQLVLNQNHGLNLVGVANSNKFWFDADGLHKPMLEQSDALVAARGSRERFAAFLDGLSLSPSERSDHPDGADLIEAVVEDLFPEETIFVDLSSASGSDADAFYQLVFENDGAVVTANKAPLVGPMSEWDKLVAAKASGNFGNAATVMAGTGGVLSLVTKYRPQIVSWTGSLSGTLAYLTSEMERFPEVVFSDVLASARALGVTERDPRDDLGGDDVRWKGLILARTLGHRLELTDVRVGPFVDESFLQRGKSVDTFMSGIAGANDVMRGLFPGSGGPVQRYVARFFSDDGSPKVEVGFQEFPADHPMVSLNGTENRVVMELDEMGPVTISGPGAGTWVTAWHALQEVFSLAKRS